jgi:hypothetical protein
MSQGTCDLGGGLHFDGMMFGRRAILSCFKTCLSRTGFESSVGDRDGSVKACVKACPRKGLH